MLSSSREFLLKLLGTPAPSGAEVPIQRVVREHMSSYADTVDTDVHGNVIFGLNPGASRKVMLAAHCDQIGFMVKHITKDGFIYVYPIGGVDVGVLPGARVQIISAKGLIPGVFGRKAIHLQTSDERTKSATDLEKLWIDVGASSASEVSKLGVKIGDYATFHLEPIELAKGMISGAGLDNRVGLFVVLEALRLCSQKSKPLKVGLFVVSTVQEELGTRGIRTSSYALNPEVGISVDVSHASDNPSTDGLKLPSLALGKGPGIFSGPNINPVVQQLLVATAKRRKIPYQVIPYPRVLPNDAGALQINKSGVATASLAIPNRYMHTQAEVCSVEDLTHAAELLAAFASSISERTSFIPQ